MTAKKYNYCFDFLKGIACICVVLMHCEFPGLLGILVQSVSRFCVPYFFMISGYYCYKKESNWKNTIPKVKRIIVMACAASLFYLLFALIQHLLGAEVSFAIGKRTIATWIIFNQPVIIAGQLWFLFALIYVYFLYMIVQKYNLYKVAYISIPVLICMYILLAQGMNIAGISVSNYIYRNFLIEGFPLFMLGHWLNKNKQKINVNNSFILIVIGISSIMCILERMLMGRDFGINICTFIQVIALFIYGIKNEEKGKGIIQIIGKEYSMFVYILHPFIWHSLEHIYNIYRINDNIIALYLMPILVIIFTLLISIMCRYVANKIEEKKSGLYGTNKENYNTNYR